MRFLLPLITAALIITVPMLAGPVGADNNRLADNGGIAAPDSDEIDKAIAEARRDQREKEQARRERLIPHKRQWIKIGRCEQPGKGRWGINWSMNGSAYSGGLGFANSTWAAFRLRGYPARAGDASWFEQMRVAERLYDRYRFSPWDCPA